MTSIRHIALYVSHLRAAEAYYQRLFQMQLIGREAELDDGVWYTLPRGKDWDDTAAAGIELGMVALRKGEFVLALFKGKAPKGQVFAIGLDMPAEEIARVRAGLPADAEVFEDYAQSLSFRDRYQITWQISVPGNEFRTAGEISGRWVDVWNEA